MSWTQSDVAERGGPSDTTLSKIEAGDSGALASRTLRRLDVGLGWEPGTARRIYMSEAAVSGVVEGYPLAAATDDELLAELARRLRGRR